MAAKKYRARTIQEAIRTIKEEIGPDALILSTKRIPRGVKDPYGKDMFEVEAVAGDHAGGPGKVSPEGVKAAARNFATALGAMGGKDPETPGIELGGAGRAPGTEQVGVGRGEGTEYGGPGRAPGAEQGGAGGNSDPEQVGAPKAARAASAAGSGRAGAGGSQGDLAGLDRLLHAEGAAGGGFETIRSELTSIKEMLFLMGRGDGLPGLAVDHPEALTLYSRLVKLGISEKRAQLLVGDACSATGGGKEEITAGVLKRILNTFDVASPFAPAAPSRANKKRYVAAFVGPTGVGKTTTIAKLAAELSLKQKRKVGLISVDSYRIGALEQLKTYAAIMGLPCLPAFNREDLRDALEKMKGREIILIDTAGHSHLDGKRMGELEELMGGENAISVHLVLSVTSGRMNMKEAAENFGVLNPESYVFTKVDETRIRGTVIEQVMDYSMPISYITNGQRVPEDIVPATKKNVLQFILN